MAYTREKVTILMFITDVNILYTREIRHNLTRRNCANIGDEPFPRYDWMRKSTVLTKASFSMLLLNYHWVIFHSSAEKQLMCILLFPRFLQKYYNLWTKYRSEWYDTSFVNSSCKYWWSSITLSKAIRA